MKNYPNSVLREANSDLYHGLNTNPQLAINQFGCELPDNINSWHELSEWFKERADKLKDFSANCKKFAKILDYLSYEEDVAIGHNEKPRFTVDSLRFDDRTFVKYLCKREHYTTPYYMRKVEKDK